VANTPGGSRVGATVTRIAAVLVLIVGAARADEIDDHPLAGDLRAAFGRDVSSCRDHECNLDVSAVECTTRGTATSCRAGRRTASGATAERLADHLRGMTDFEARGSDTQPKAPVVAIARIACRSSKLASQDTLHGHCSVERRSGDAALDGVLSGLKTREGYPVLDVCKLGQFCWTGTVHATCNSDGCTLACPAGSEEAQWLDGCHLGKDQTVEVSDAAFARQLTARAGAAKGTISCFSTGGALDGGLTSMVACNVRPDSR
jgi:hypothetical protein